MIGDTLPSSCSGNVPGPNRSIPTIYWGSLPLDSKIFVDSLGGGTSTRLDVRSLTTIVRILNLRFGVSRETRSPFPQHCVFTV
jgi:hypothetical protein